MRRFRARTPSPHRLPWKRTTTTLPAEVSAMPRIAVPLLFVALPLAAAAQENTFTPHHVSKLKVVMSATVSPDGKNIAYVLAVPRNIPKEPNGNAWTELHVVDTHGAATPYLTGQVNVDA